jgi:hypothetical protein
LTLGRIFFRPAKIFFKSIGQLLVNHNGVIRVCLLSVSSVSVCIKVKVKSNSASQTWAEFFPSSFQSNWNQRKKREKQI